MKSIATFLGALVVAWAVLAGGIVAVLTVGFWINPEWLDSLSVVTTDGAQITCATSPWATLLAGDDGSEWVWCAGRAYRLTAPGGVAFGAGSDLRSILVDRF